MYLRQLAWAASVREQRERLLDCVLSRVDDYYCDDDKDCRCRMLERLLECLTVTLPRVCSELKREDVEGRVTRPVGAVSRLARAIVCSQGRLSLPTRDPLFAPLALCPIYRNGRLAINLRELLTGTADRLCRQLLCDSTILAVLVSTPCEVFHHDKPHTACRLSRGMSLEAVVVAVTDVLPSLRLTALGPALSSLGEPTDAVSIDHQQLRLTYTFCRGAKFPYRFEIRIYVIPRSQHVRLPLSDSDRTPFRDLLPDSMPVNLTSYHLYSNTALPADATGDYLSTDSTADVDTIASAAGNADIDVFAAFDDAAVDAVLESVDAADSKALDLDTDADVSDNRSLSDRTSASWHDRTLDDASSLDSPSQPSDAPSLLYSKDSLLDERSSHSGSGTASLVHDVDGAPLVAGVPPAIFDLDDVRAYTRPLLRALLANPESRPAYLCISLAQSSRWQHVVVAHLLHDRGRCHVPAIWPSIRPRFVVLCRHTPALHGCPCCVDTVRGVAGCFADTVVAEYDGHGRVISVVRY